VHFLNLLILLGGERLASSLLKAKHTTELGLNIRKEFENGKTRGFAIYRSLIQMQI
jgi:hypothetical protein